MNPSIYVVGAQCTGETTSIDALNDSFTNSFPSLRILVIAELAKDVLRRHRVRESHFTKIRAIETNEGDR